VDRSPLDKITQAGGFFSVNTGGDTVANATLICTNFGECEVARPKGISIDFIARLNRDYLKARFVNRKAES
jgi:hypothetical protein